jgi:hypothetical protein
MVKTVIEQTVRRALGPYGYSPVQQHLGEECMDCGRGRTLRLMHELDLVDRTDALDLLP